MPRYAHIDVCGTVAPANSTPKTSSSPPWRAEPGGCSQAAGLHKWQIASFLPNRFTPTRCSRIWCQWHYSNLISGELQPPNVLGLPAHNCSTTDALTSPSMDKDGCSIDGNGDLYGLGVRIGVYCQWVSSWIRMLVDEESIEDVHGVNAIFVFAVIIATILA